MTLAQRWRRFWNRTYFPTREEYVTRLKASAPTVTREEMERLERKWRQQPVDYDAGLPIG
jgi:hypothetical protein